MKIIDNISVLLGDELKAGSEAGAKIRVAASCFSIFAYEALRDELESVEELEFILTDPTFIPNEALGRSRREKREFFIPKQLRETALYGTEFEIHLRNKLTQKAIAKQCADWIRRKATFKSNATDAPMQQFATIEAHKGNKVFSPISGFSAVDLGYQPGNAVSNFTHAFEDDLSVKTYLSLFDQVWANPANVEDVTDQVLQHIEAVYQENSPQRIYFLILYNIFREFLEEVDEDVLPNDQTGYLDSLVWNKLFNYQRDAATGVINKLETYNGCILADSVGLGKTFTALAVVKYYELRNKSVLVLCPKKLADNWRNYNTNLKTNLFAADRFNYDVLCHTDLSRTSGESARRSRPISSAKNSCSPRASRCCPCSSSTRWQSIGTTTLRTKKANIRSEKSSSAHSLVSYDVIGKLAEGADLTRGTIGKILTGMSAAKFSTFQANPEQFISEAARIIKEQKATTVIEHLTYDATADRYDTDIFPATQSGTDLTQAVGKLRNHIYDYAVVDSGIERKFVEDLDTSGEIVVYSKLPKGFLIPTPVGDYNPDWAIAFKQKSVQHIYFVAETKGSQPSLKFRELEREKIKCARKFFKEIANSVPNNCVKYDVVSDFSELMSAVRGN